MQTGKVGTSAARELVSLLREIFGQAILVISWSQAAGCTKPYAKAGGVNLIKEVNASGDSQNSSRRNHHYGRWLYRTYEGTA